MRIFGIDFAPVCIPLHRRLETFAAVFYIFTFAYVGLITYISLIWGLLFSPTFRFPCFLCLFWSYYDKNAENTGKKISFAIRNWQIWKHLARYFPVKLITHADISPNENYLFVSCPHGIFAHGYVTAFSTNGCNIDERFPGMKIYSATVCYLLRASLVRELALRLGAIIASEATIVNILREKGNSVLLVPGGASETALSKPGTYRTLLARRKGFARIALKTGVSLVPTIGFGEPELYDQYVPAKGTLPQKFQESFKAMTGIVWSFYYGRGIFQYSFGIVPRRSPIHVVMGAPIKVPKVENPSNEQIEEVCRQFCEEITALFEREKTKYLQNYSNVYLQFE